MTNCSCTGDRRRSDLPARSSQLGPIRLLCGADDIVEKVHSVLMVVERLAPVLAQLQKVEHATLDVQRERGVRTLV